MGKDYVLNQPTNYIIYQDANNLYGCSMSEYLPHKDLKFNNKIEFDTILNTFDDHETGYILEVDLHVPEELHDKFKEFPPAPKTLTPDIDWFTPYQRELGANTGRIHNGVFHGTNKLIPHLHDYKHMSFITTT